MQNETNTTTATQSSWVQPWLLASRPKTLPAAIGPVLVGTSLAIALGVFAPLPALAALVCALLLQIGSNFANDYFDFKKGADTAERLGPTRATAAGLITPSQMKLGMIVVFGLAALVGLYLVWVGGVPILVLGIAAILAAILYTGGPFPYGYYGFGEFFVFLFFGVAAVAGTFYVQALTVASQAWWSALAVGSLVTAILVVNNLRDRETDARANKRTLAVMLGRRGAEIEYFFFLGFAAACTVGMAWRYSWWLLLPLLTVIPAIPLIRSVLREEGRALNKTLAGTSRLGLIYSLLLAVGWLLSAWLQ
jgi:1,4-dihydroxy-2-naphthoate octaprenyltransferase